MNKLIDIMAEDMNIQPYKKESRESFEFRVIYSALGLWCLKSALRENEGVKGISKIAQSILLHELVEKYVSLFSSIKTLVFVSKNTDIAVFIRNIYEQTGYLLTQDNNYNVLNKSGETLALSEHSHLYLGLPDECYSINGLGVHIRSGKREIQLQDYLVRDCLKPEEYLKAQFDECDFDEKDINIDELEFFNPFYYGNISNSWHKRMKSEFTMARKSCIRKYYRVIKKEYNTYLFAEDNNIDDFDALTGAEFRRIYIALKFYYDNPMQLLVCPIDEEYSYIRILGQLPNREYYYLLMNAWPKNNFLDRNNFIIRNELTTRVTEVLGAIGFVVRNGEFYG